MVLPLPLRYLLYLAAFKFRSIHCSQTGIWVIAGSPFLVQLIPVPIPETLFFALTVGIAIYLMTRYTEADVFPDVLVITVVLELISRSVMLPLLESLVM